MYTIRVFLIKSEAITITATFLENQVITFDMPINLILGYLAVILRFLFVGLFDEMVEIYTHQGKIEKLGANSSPNEINPLIHAMNNDRGEGSSKNPNTGRSSSPNYLDYTFSSDESSYGSDQDKTPKKGEWPIIARKSSKEIFDISISSSTNEELQNKINRFQLELDEYKRSGAKVPAAKEQIGKLEEKIEKCSNKLAENLGTLDTESALSKGKEPDYKGKGKEPDYKGKGKEPDYKGKEPYYKGKEPDYKGKEPEYKGEEPDYKGKGKNTEPGLNKEEVMDKGKKPQPASKELTDKEKKIMDKEFNAVYFKGRPNPAISSCNEKIDGVLLLTGGDIIISDTNKASEAIQKWVNELKIYHDIPWGTLPPGPETIDLMTTLVRDQGTVYTKYVWNRTEWLKGRKLNTTESSKEKLNDIFEKIRNIQQDYFNKTGQIDRFDNQETQLRVYYGNLNEYRNKVLKELNKADSVILEDIKKSAFKGHTGLKKALNIDYKEAKDAFNNEDQYLKRKVGEILYKRN